MIEDARMVYIACQELRETFEVMTSGAFGAGASDCRVHWRRARAVDLHSLDIGFRPT